jgi:hypothetical protein
MRAETMSELSAEETAILVSFQRPAPTTEPRHRLRARMLAGIGCLAAFLILTVAIARPSAVPAQRTGPTAHLAHPPVMGNFRGR